MEKEMWKLSIEGRLKRVLKRIPTITQMNDGVVKSSRQVPVEHREDFLQDINDLIERLERHLYWWKKVLTEAQKAPHLTVIHNKESEDKRRDLHE